MGAYFPHGGYSDAKAQDMYLALSEIHPGTTSKRESTILGGDFNAEVGSASQYDRGKVIVKHGVNHESPRGRWLKDWSGSEKSGLANAFYPNHENAKLIYVGPDGQRRQIDVIFGGSASSSAIAGFLFIGIF